jgi:protocatechuate 3,4-dioxygenase beta subunit
VDVPESDLYLYSEDIHFSITNPDPQEEITIFAEIHYWAQSTDLIAEDVPINFYATFPGEEKTLIGGTMIDSITVGSPDFGSRYVFTSWKNDREGIYIIEVEIDPGYMEEFVLNNAATRAIIVGELVGGYGMIEGQVTDILGGVSDVVIELYDADGSTLQESRLTNDTGYYLFEAVPPGDYQVHIQTPEGYIADTETKPASVMASAITTVNFYLSMVEMAPPIADAGGPYSGDAGSSIVLDAGASYDPDGEIVLYEWDCDNDGEYEESTADPEMSYTWDSEYSGTIRLRVTDNDGLTATDTATVTITAPYLCGDLDYDGDVDGADRNILRVAFGTTEEDNGFIRDADYDEDGNIDYSDYQLWYYCYKQFVAGN